MATLREMKQVVDAGEMVMRHEIGDMLECVDRIDDGYAYTTSETTDIDRFTSFEDLLVATDEAEPEWANTDWQILKVDGKEIT